MRSVIASLATLFCLLSIFACSKPESKLIGTWVNEKTPSSITFNNDHTGVIHQRTQADLPADLVFKWTMLGSDQFRVDVLVSGAAAGPAAQGTIVGNDTMVLQNDTFKKMK